MTCRSKRSMKNVIIYCERQVIAVYMKKCHSVFEKSRGHRMFVVVSSKDGISGATQTDNIFML
ncbi:Uncharacterized protein dnm_020770 [Desulfonema magnum]|uniref:Uncharacterized protein n=1 Tax=Desulfonema magnum TaxID=45655 RepID=A0A975BHX8_9BACT|nr:Uncharacterized protein dnm_020770 [Desulfonema magnum]